ncbi:DUF1684 domain-containing protein [uncultured Polaribacter sp.]|uniref:DUF1684 domain-containing protein n=1 Tax=uncultured Polaribacter sp. TaxID=174711 RepID=UPI00261A5997|nr:DUF1684 domain-containing protein [uncultured Polaribacter sp.]
MKKIFILVTIFSLISCNSQDKKPIPGVTAYQKQLNMQFKDASRSPLKRKDLKKFTALDFFKIDPSFIVKAKLEKSENTPLFKMATTTARTAFYKEYGVLIFNLKGKELQLTVYQSQEDLENENTKDVLFLPFTDQTSGNESYGAGRYMNLSLNDVSKENTITLNFNNTYNPYCAYDDRYSCPLTPRKNHLDIAIKAGIKAFKPH